MKYDKILPGRFLARPNRFIAHIDIDGKTEICHVKNTGRCKELLVPGCRVYCARSSNPNRKTKYDLIAAEKGQRLINMDSQAPNAAVKEWLEQGGFGEISQLRPETVYKDSRFDFSFFKNGRQCFLEVKGVTLEIGGVCAFPDAPTVRGTKHLSELTKAVSDGYGAYVLFVIQMADVAYLHPNDVTDPVFSAALRQAFNAGVKVMAMDCTVTPDTMMINKPVEVQIN